MKAGDLPTIPGLAFEREIGRGASSVVYLATQERFDRRVAVKVLDLPGQSELVGKLFLNECRTLGRLTAHPAIVTIFDAGLDPDGRPYLVMEYLPDGSLADELIRSGPLEVDRVLRVGIELAGALHTTHLHDIVHGDVKPQNVLRTRPGGAAIADFGIARFSTASAATTRVPLLTPLHAAPELFDGDAPTPRTDVYGLCSTLFELLDGRAALGDTDESPLVVVGRMARGERRDLDRARVPADLAAVIDAGLAHDPAARPATAEVLGEQLRSVERALGAGPTALVVFDRLPDGDDGGPGAPRADPASVRTIPPPGSGPTRRRRAALVALAVAGVAAVAGIGVLLGRGDGPDAVVASDSTVPTTVVPTTVAPSTTEGSPYPGLQPDVTYDVPRVPNTSSVISSKMGDPSAIFAPVSPTLTIIDTPYYLVERQPAIVRWQAYNARPAPECPGFLSRPMTITGMWDKTGGNDEYQSGVRVVEFETEAQAAEAFVALSLEQGAGPGECTGLLPEGGVADYDALSIDHRDPPLALPAAVERHNSWLNPPPPSNPDLTAVRAGIAQVGRYVTSGYVASRTGPPSPEQMGGLLGAVVERLVD